MENCPVVLIGIQPVFKDYNVTIKAYKNTCNLEIKKDRYKNRDKKNYLVALLFEKLLVTSPDLSKYTFNNIDMANNLGEKQLANDLLKIYNKVQS